MKDDKDLEQIISDEELRKIISRTGLVIKDKLVKEKIDEVKKEILKSPKKLKQLAFSFLPLELSRISPFCPMSRRQMRSERPFERLKWVTSWGEIKFTGEKLSVFDEDVLLSALVLVKKQKSRTVTTTRYEFCQLLGITPAKGTYRSILSSLDRMCGAKITLKVKSGNKKIIRMVSSPILSGMMIEEGTGRIILTVNNYFLNMYAKGLTISLDLNFRRGLKGDISKLMFRFLESQRDKKFSCHLLTISSAINLDIKHPLFKLRELVKRGLSELRKKKYLKVGYIDDDIVVTEKSEKIVKK